VSAAAGRQADADPPAVAPEPLFGVRQAKRYRSGSIPEQRPGSAVLSASRSWPAPDSYQRNGAEMRFDGRSWPGRAGAPYSLTQIGRCQRVLGQVSEIRYRLVAPGTVETHSISRWRRPTRSDWRPPRSISVTSAARDPLLEAISSRPADRRLGPIGGERRPLSFRGHEVLPAEVHRRTSAILVARAASAGFRIRHVTQILTGSFANIAG
jgi:hypothetical protein